MDRGARGRLRDLLRAAADRRRAAALLRARWNSDDYPTGEYEFEAIGHDRAGNVAVGTRRLGGSPMVLPSPLKTRTVLDAWLRRPAIPATTSCPSEGARPTAGAWRSPPAPPRRPAARGSRALRPGREHRRTRTTAISSGPDGRFALRLEPGPSREVLAVFAGTRRQSTSVLAARAARSAQRPAPACFGDARPRSAAGPVVFSGSVCRPASCHSGDSRSQLQFRLPGLPWTEFRTVQTERPRPLPLPLPLQRRRQPRGALPVPRLRPRTGRLAL